jgi:hypothetical protein
MVWFPDRGMPVGEVLLRAFGQVGWGWGGIQRSSQDGLAEGGHHVLAVLGRGGEVSADCVAVLGVVFAGEAPGDVLLDLTGP